MDTTPIAARGREITGLETFQRHPEDIEVARVHELMSEMHADIPTGGRDHSYAAKSSQYLRFWPGLRQAPVVCFVHGGSWQIGTNLDSIGSRKVDYLTKRGYAFATINFSLVPKVTVKEQVQEVADAVGYLVKQAHTIGSYDPSKIILMGHSSGAHVVTLLGTDASYLEHTDVSMDMIRGVIALDGSNYNCLAELIDSPGSVTDNMLYGLGKDYEHLRVMSPTYHTQGVNAAAFLLLHVQRHGGIRQAMELATVLTAGGTSAELHVFEGVFFEGHIRLLLKLGDSDYPATKVMADWLERHCPVMQETYGSNG